MALAGNKSALSSLTIRGVLVLLIPMLFKLFGIDLGADAAGLFNNFVEAGLSFAGLAMVVYGRFRATQAISLNGPT